MREEGSDCQEKDMKRNAIHKSWEIDRRNEANERFDLI